MNRLGIAVAAVLASAAFIVGGCSSGVINKGGDTTCKEFNAQDEEKQNAAVSKMLKDDKGEEASNLQLSATRTAVSAFCKTLGKDSSKISEAKI